MTEVPAVTLCVIRAAVTAGDSHIVCCTPEVDTSPQEPGGINVVCPGGKQDEGAVVFCGGGAQYVNC